MTINENMNVVCWNYKGELIYEIIPFDRHINTEYIAEIIETLLKEVNEKFYLITNGYVFNKLNKISCKELAQGVIISDIYGFEMRKTKPILTFTINKGDNDDINQRHI